MCVDKGKHEKFVICYNSMKNSGVERFKKVPIALHKTEIQSAKFRTKFDEIFVHNEADDYFKHEALFAWGSKREVSLKNESKIFEGR